MKIIYGVVSVALAVILGMSTVNRNGFDRILEIGWLAVSVLMASAIVVVLQKSARATLINAAIASIQVAISIFLIAYLIARTDSGWFFTAGLAALAAQLAYGISQIQRERRVS
ncbi:hypothetical protein [Haematomicrobium sanguinis]|uniref:hypothetical protein n=1 Tax=Haematomicrobium sanguinis TaxID=479106 RepID=UPI00047ED725|nr:hypothetical protein [Haematomicrobium sanguinis]